MSDTFELRSLVSWLETRPANGEYDYLDGNVCLVCQYLQAAGVPAISAGAGLSGGLFPLGYWRDRDGVKHPLPPGFDAASIGDGGNRDWTYGAALTRARALLATEESAHV